MGLTDTQMDLYGNFDTPANPLPIKCLHCRFPNMDFVANPYLLAKGVSSPAETATAQVGNFLVRERVRRILELAVPDACSFYPTAEMKTRKATPWSLAVPGHILEIRMKATAPRCSQCGEPRDGYIYADAQKHYEQMKQFDCGHIDVFKELRMGPCHAAEEDLRKTNELRTKGGLPPLPWSYHGIDAPPHPERWTRLQFHRDLYFSVRLNELFRKAKVRGQLVASDEFGEPSPEDLAWVDEKLAILASEGLAAAPKAGKKQPSGSTAKWFKQYVRRNAGKAARKVDWASIENKHKLKLPADYKEFVEKTGSKSFDAVNQEAGFVATIRPAEKLDFRTYRRGLVPDLDEDSAQIDGIMFAHTDHGDCFVFDVSAKGDDYPVFWYQHESNSFEPFAENFAACLKRFAERT